jgi:mono/diheme cytochrome c family protein
MASRDPSIPTVWWPAALVAVMALPAGAAERVDYNHDVKPLLGKCVACHGALRQKNGLRLDTAELAKQGGDSGPAIEPGKSGESILIDVLTGANGWPRMPPEGEGEAFSPAQIATLTAWIDQGAEAPPEEIPPDPKTHWAYAPPQKVPVPVPADPDWAGNPIDAFLAVAREHQGLSDAPLADRATLLRRVTIDLVGLPPTHEELSAFLADSRPDAYERVVDRLLQSPRYAERWGRHWMDIWRYSDWYGSRKINQLRNSRRHIWRWRDWIVESLEADKGYDRMVLEMLAPDEFAPGDLDTQRAGGFLGRNYSAFNRNVWLQDAVEYTSMALLGTTMKCARCHDHKYDPISHEEYYHFRAFFEPYQVRTDPIAGQVEKPAPGDTLAHGHDIVYDGDLDVPTYLFERGDEKQPRKDRPLAPGVPAVMGGRSPEIVPVSLPVAAYYPEMRPDLREQLLADARQAEETAAAAIRQAAADLAATRARMAEIEARGGRPLSRRAAPPFVAESGAASPEGTWRAMSGAWRRDEGRLLQTSTGRFRTRSTTAEHPTDFQARIRYRFGGMEQGRAQLGVSIGCAFDVSESAADWQAVTTVAGSKPKLKAFHRVATVDTSPAGGVKQIALDADEEVTLELAVKGDLLNVWVNGVLELAYRLPQPRQAGRFALWTDNTAAEFREVAVEPLSPDVILVAETRVTTPAPFGGPTKESVARQIAAVEAQATPLQKALELARLERRSLEARAAAEVAKYRKAAAEETTALARAAAKADRELAMVRTRRAIVEAERAVADTRGLFKPDDESSKKLLAEAQAKLAAANSAAAAAAAAVDEQDATYSPLGPVYPQTSSGRRLALARWIVDRANPLTARVAVNHMWLRHFGTALVPSVFNFGLNGKRPTHPELLDWLAVEFMETGWSTKAIHRLMVTSRAYRLQSHEAGPEDPNLARDPENRFYWRANPRRMEAEVVRDGLLHLAGRLDVARSGPELEPTAADSTPRRSLYFRNTPDDQALMLDMFDMANAAECYQREESIVPQQALALANGVFAQEQARLLTARIVASAGLSPTDAAAFVGPAFVHVLARQPTPAERDLCEHYLADQAARYAGSAGLTKVASGPTATVKPATDPLQRARVSLVHVLLNYNEFVVVR